MECSKIMESNCVYGVVVKNVLYSNRMELRINQDNGIYSIDMSKDDFQNTLSPANIEDARKFFSKASKISIIRGISFHDGLIPENPVAYPKLPIKVIDATYDEFEEVEAAFIRGKICYFLQTVNTAKAYPLSDLKERLESSKKFSETSKIDDIKGVTPEMRIVYTFHLLEKKRKALEEPVSAIKAIMAVSGATIKSVNKVNRGFQVIWTSEGYTIDTLLDKNFRVIEAGFCVSNYDDTQSARSVVNLLHDYIEEGSHVHITRI